MDEEDDDNYRERIHLAPEGYSVAGPSGAYEYFARQYSSLVSEVRVDSPSDGVVDIRILLQDGELPEQSFLEGIYSYLSDKERRPLTDKVEVHAPDIVNYNIDLIYYISSNNMGSEELIKTKVTEAVEEYIRWQKLKIGRDINPSELTAKIILAGAKRVEINSPIHTVIDKNSVAIVDSINATYGGIEDE
jgi:phage-related baseplate assembly protein